MDKNRFFTLFTAVAALLPNVSFDRAFAAQRVVVKFDSLSFLDSLIAFDDSYFPLFPFILFRISRTFVYVIHPR